MVFKDCVGGYVFTSIPKIVAGRKIQRGCMSNSSTSLCFEQKATQQIFSYEALNGFYLLTKPLF